MPASKVLDTGLARASPQISGYPPRCSYACISIHMVSVASTSIYCASIPLDPWADCSLLLSILLSLSHSSWPYSEVSSSFCDISFATMSATERQGSSDGSSTGEKGITQHIEQVKTNERVPGHTNYYEKDGIRTYGDDEGSSRMAAKRHSSLTDFRPRSRASNDNPPIDELDRHGVPLDWITNPRLPLRRRKTSR